LKFWALLIAGAVSPFLFTSTLPTDVVLVLLLLTLLAALPSRFRVYCLLPAAFLLTTLAVNQRLSQRLPISDTKMIRTLTGVVGSLPETRGDMQRFIFLPDKTSPSAPSKVRVYWYKNRDKAKDKMPVLHAGEHWQLKLELRAPRSRINFSGGDAERWYFSDGISALGYVKAGDNLRLSGPDRFDLNHWRELVRDKLNSKAGHVPAFRTLVALAIADRRDMRASDRMILSATGTGHLLAISGLHIGLAATLGFYLGKLILLIVTGGVRQRLAIVLPWMMAWLAALSYAALAAFAVSTQRALIMLSVATLLVLGRRVTHPAVAWMIAMTLVLVFDPFAPLRAGFWFSFVAVAVLMMIFVSRQGKMPLWRKMLLAQVGISLVMAPLGMYWFQQASLPGLLANLVAIPLISMVTVPLVLVSLPLLWLGYSVHWLFIFLESLSSIQPLAFSATGAPAFISVLLAMVGAVLLLLPRGVPLRFAGLLLMLPLLLPASRLADSIQAQIDFLDVGQGLAVIVSDRDYLMLYDTGPGNGIAGEQGWDLVNGTIKPAIKASGMTPDLIVASHADLDHAGGLIRLQSAYPDSRYLASLPHKRNGIQSCLAGDGWQGGGLLFNVLHPSPGLPYMGNDSSCVISVKAEDFGLLLSGDISRVIEQRLVSTGIFSHDVITVPHHGSSTSSSQAFLHTINPKLALISAASNNRFGFPREDVMKRYSSVGITTLNTADCGGIRVTAETGKGILLESARTKRAAIWRWPASSGCP